MKLFTNKKLLQKEIRKFNNISFVPTMGALHRGHESIIRKSVKGSGKTLVSIFVNPKQFNNKKDLNTYPRNSKNDIKILRKLKVHYLYKPSYDDIYKFKTKKKILWTVHDLWPFTSTEHFLKNPNKNKQFDNNPYY